MTTYRIRCEAADGTTSYRTYLATAGDEALTMAEREDAGVVGADVVYTLVPLTYADRAYASPAERRRADRDEQRARNGRTR